MKEFTLQASFNDVGWLRKKIIGLILQGISLSVKLPESWEDLGHNQFLMVSRKLMKEEPKPQAQASILMGLLQVNRFSKMLITADDAYIFLLPCLQFLENPVKLSTPKIKRLRGEYFGPGKKLLGLCLKQYGLAEMLCQSFAQTKNKELLIHLAVILYACDEQQPSKEKILDALKEENQEKRFLLFKKLPEQVMFAVYLNYLGLRNIFILDYPHFYPSVKSKGKEGGEQEPTDWKALIIGISNGPFGDYQSTSMEPVANVMKHLDMEAKKNTRRPVILDEEEQ